MENSLSLLNKEKPTLTQLALINMPRGTAIEDAQRIALKEIENLELIMSVRPELNGCTANSLLQAVKQTINDNLTLAPSAGLVYLYPGKVCVGINASNQKIYENVLQYDPTANGRLSIARQAGRILDNKRPTIKFDGTGKVETVTVEFLVPSCPAPRWEVITFGLSHFAKWQQKSAAKFGGTTNANYTSWNKGIDPDFASSKSIRHGLNKLGTNMNERSARTTGVANEYTALNSNVVIKESEEENGFTPHTEVESNINQSTDIKVDPNLM